MSGATYRIEVSFDPQNQSYPWDARVYRVADDHLSWFTFAATPGEAEVKAREMIRAAVAHADTKRTVFVDDDGQDAEQFSVRV